MNFLDKVKNGKSQVFLQLSTSKILIFHPRRLVSSYNNKQPLKEFVEFVIEDDGFMFLPTTVYGNPKPNKRHFYHLGDL